MRNELHNGWAIQFKSNVHMYCHSLKASKGSRSYTIPCENSPKVDGLVLMWLYELNLDEETCLDLLKGLVMWACASGITYLVYIDPDRYETNENSVRNA